MNINLLIVYLDETRKNISAGASDIVAFEEKFDLSIAKLQQNVKLTHLFFLAWHAEKRTGATKDDFTKWLEGVSSIEAQDVKK